MCQTELNQKFIKQCQTAWKSKTTMQYTMIWKLKVINLRLKLKDFNYTLDEKIILCQFSFISIRQFDMVFVLNVNFAIFVGYLQKSISVAISRKILHCAIIGLLLLLLLSIWGNSFFGWWYVILCVHHLVPCLIKVKFK